MDRCEVRFIDRGGIHLLLEGSNFMLSFDEHPQLRQCSADDLFKVHFVEGRLVWPSTWVDIRPSLPQQPSTTAAIPLMRSALESVLDSLMCQAYGEARHELRAMLREPLDAFAHFGPLLQEAHQALLYSDAGARNAMLILRGLLRELGDDLWQNAS